MTVDRHHLEKEFEALLRTPGALAFLDKAAFDGLWFWDLENPQDEWVSGSFWKALGFTPRHRPADWRELLFSDDRDLFLEAFWKHISNPSRPFDQVLRFRSAAGETITMRCRGQALREEGKPTRMFGVHTILKTASGYEHDRQLGELLEMSDDAVFAWSLREGVKRWNRGAVGLFGYSSQSALGQDPNELTQAIYPEGWEDVQARLEAGLTWSGEVERRCANGASIFTSARLSPIQIAGDDVLILQIDRDMTAEHKANERLRLLNRELNHRVKNLFAIVQGLVSVSGRGEQDASVVTDKIQARIAALAAAHLISIDEEDVRTISFSRVLEAVLAPYEQRNDKLILKGMEAKLPRRAVTPVGMIFHELATNAVKYGAWAQEEGRLTVTWMTDDFGDGDAVLHVRWSEKFPRKADGTPEITPGLGLPLIQQSARQLDGELTRNWSADGMETVLSFSLSERVGGSTFSTNRPSMRPSNVRPDVN